MALIWDRLREIFHHGEMRPIGAITVNSAGESAAAAFDAAYVAAVSLVARMLAAREFRTFVDGEEIRGSEWYLWNYDISTNYTPYSFWYDVIDRLLFKGEALIIDVNNELLSADTWAVTDSVLSERVYSEVTVGNLEFNKRFSEADVIHLSMSGGGQDGYRQYRNLETIRESYTRLVRACISGYIKSRGIKGILEIDAIQAGNKEFQEKLNTLKNEGFAKFAEAANALMPTYKGMKYVGLGEKTYTGENTRDVRYMIDDASDIVGRSLGIPPQMLTGNNVDTEPAMAYFLSSFFDPLCRMISAEITRKRYGRAETKSGSYLIIDTRQIRHIDLISDSARLPTLISSGLSTNDIYRLVGVPTEQGEWADKHYVSLNNAEIGKGGEINEQL